jgi:hypothetical protein
MIWTYTFLVLFSTWRHRVYNLSGDRCASSGSQNQSLCLSLVIICDFVIKKVRNGKPVEFCRRFLWSSSSNRCPVFWVSITCKIYFFLAEIGGPLRKVSAPPPSVLWEVLTPTYVLGCPRSLFLRRQIEFRISKFAASLAVCRVSEKILVRDRLGLLVILISSFLLLLRKRDGWATIVERYSLHIFPSSSAYRSGTGCNL